MLAVFAQSPALLGLSVGLTGEDDSYATITSLAINIRRFGLIPSFCRNVFTTSFVAGLHLPAALLPLLLHSFGERE